MVEHYGLGWLPVTIGPTDVYDITVDEPVRAEIYAEGGRYYLRPLDHLSFSGRRSMTYYLGYKDEDVTSPVALSHNGRIRIGLTVIDFRDEEGRGAPSGPPSFDDSAWDSAAGGAETDRAGGGLALNALLENEEDLAWLVPEIMRRAARCYERAGMMRDAAQCWTEAGEDGHAAEVYLGMKDFARAAPLLLSQGRYREALRCYREWLGPLPQRDPLIDVTAHLGAAACLTLLGEEREAREHYMNARRRIEEVEYRSVVASARCWEALGNYGVLVGRADLVQIAYERALETYGGSYEHDRLRVAEAYLKAVGGNHLLASRIEQLIAEWAPLPSEGAQQESAPPLTADKGVRFGDWVFWQCDAKLALLTHRESRTRIEIWTDSTGWFMLSRNAHSHMIMTDGMTQPIRNRKGLDDYYDMAPTLPLGSIPPRIENYAIKSSPAELVLTNTVSGVAINVMPDRPHFRFVNRENKLITFKT